MTSLLILFELHHATDSHESHTKMADVISTFTSLSTLLSEYNLNLDSTLEDITLISRRYEQDIAVHGIMPERPTTLSPSLGNLHLFLNRLAGKSTIFGRQLYLRKQKLNFIRHCETALQNILSHITERSSTSPRNTLLHARNHTDRQPLSILADSALNSGPIRRLSDSTDQDTEDEA